MATQPDHELLFASDCPVCGQKGTVVSPDYCSEGHGAECPDRICVQCGSALAVAVVAPPTSIDLSDSVPTVRSA